jgi:glycerol uptake facilitator-like aquaporin
MTKQHTAGMLTSMPRRVAAEFSATAILVAAVIGSGIMGERLAGGNAAIALLANTLATAAALVALILTFAAVSGAHMNPVVSLVEVTRGRLARGTAALYIVAQVAGAVAGAILANAMFQLPPFFASQKIRAGTPLLLGEFVATLGLILVVVGSNPKVVAPAVACWIAGAYWFTSSTSFANPAVTLARSLSDTFAGIRPADVPGFIAAQCAGAAVAAVLARLLFPDKPE